MKIILCSSFTKQLEKLKSVDVSSLKDLLTTYPHTRKIKTIDRQEGAEVLKCYLFQGKVRSIIFYRTKDKNFIPVAIVKKETKKGGNIARNNYRALFHGEILKIDNDLNEGNFKILEW